ncbi:MAG TPA: chemotaxis protein [Rhodanobacteraceae bacterium]|nr:chemotaxis protein [Oleiagrimonas sp.]HET9819550.1 chemotaxis protein [Rhodanobacteraceae bacterium]
MPTSVLQKVEQFTRLAGHNRMAILTFHLGGPQIFGINVFKVREVMRRPPMEHMPSMHPLLAGSFDYRGDTIPVIDLAEAMAYPPLLNEPAATVIVTEFSLGVQAFLVSQVERIAHYDGADMAAPSPELGFGPRVNAIARTDGTLLAVIDVEQILDGIAQRQSEISPRLQRSASQSGQPQRRVLVADDSAVARMQLNATLQQLHVECVMVRNGAEALEMLESSARKGERFDLVISDIEMPKLDGYALVREIRANSAWRGLKVLLHSSLSGVFNEAMVAGVGADRFVAKFQPDVLATTILELLPAPSD